MKKFEFIDITTSDVCLCSYGKTLEEAFANAALAMFEVMVNTKKVGSKIERKISVKASDLQALLCAWLNELLIFYGSENLAFSKFEVKIDEKKLELEARCFGEEIDPERHEARTEVKAATMHKLRIEKNKLWKTRVIVDV
jgi:SHS2 domain-containing protein